MDDIRKKLADLTSNPGNVDPVELSAQLENLSKELRNVSAPSNVQQQPLLASKPENLNKELRNVSAPSNVQQQPLLASKPKVDTVKILDVQKPKINPHASQAEKWHPDQAINEAGGYSFKVCDMTRLRRFLVIGTENGTFYASSQTSVRRNVQCIQQLIKAGYGVEVINVLREYSVAGRVAKEEPILLALTSCATYKNKEVQRAAYKAVTDICNIPTKMFMFIDYCQAFINAERKRKGAGTSANKKETIR